MFVFIYSLPTLVPTGSSEGGDFEEASTDRKERRERERGARGAATNASAAASAPTLAVGMSMSIGKGSLPLHFFRFSPFSLYCLFLPPQPPFSRFL